MPETSVKYDRTKQFRGAAFLLIIALSCVVLWAIFLRPKPERVVLMDGQILVHPEVIKAGRGSIRFYVENTGTQPHQFIVIKINKPADQIPVKNGEAQFFSEPGQETTIIYNGQSDGGFSMAGPQENPPAGEPMQPGETREIQYGYPGGWLGGQTLTLLCNIPGHYEQGEFATVTIQK